MLTIFIDAIIEGLIADFIRCFPPEGLPMEIEMVII